MASQILVADSDRWILGMIATVLQRRGHAVILASDGEEALRAAIASPPDLVITDIEMPRMDGWDLVGAMRSQERLATVPVIILSAATDEESLGRGIKLDACDFVAKPFRFEELDLRVATVLARISEHSGGQKPEPSEPNVSASLALVGTLGQVGLSSLLTLLELDRKTGVLTLSRDSGGSAEEVARLSLVGGRCHAAEFEAASEPRDAECVYQLLEWNDGRFEFNQQAVTVPDRIGRSTTGLLIEGARIADEANR